MLFNNVWVTWCRPSSYRSSRFCCREATGRRCIALASLCDVRHIVVRWCCRPHSIYPAMVHLERPLFGRTVLKFDINHVNKSINFILWLIIMSRYRNGKRSSTVMISFTWGNKVVGILFKSALLSLCIFNYVWSRNFLIKKNRLAS